MIVFDVFMHKLADLAELQQCSESLWLCYEIDQVCQHRFTNLVSNETR